MLTADIALTIPRYLATVEPAAATTAIPPRPQRKMSVDLETLETLEKRLTQRPEKQELMERNILKGKRRCVRLLHLLICFAMLDDKVAPSLQAARDQLKKSQLQVSPASVEQLSTVVTKL